MTHRPAARSRGAAPRLGQRDYEILAEFRHLIRRFLGFSERAAHDAGLTPRHHQALLAIKGFQGGVMTIQDLAERLCVQHHSAVGLVDRLVEAGLVTREADAADRRRVRLRLTRDAEERLGELSAAHLRELQRVGPALREILDAIGEAGSGPE